MTPARRRIGAIVLVGALLVAAVPLIQAAPSERTVVIRVAQPEGLERVELTWWRGDDAVHHTELAGAGQTQVRLHDGEHRLQLSVYRRKGVRTEDRRIDVMSGSDEIIIDVP